MLSQSFMCRINALIFKKHCTEQDLCDILTVIGIQSILCEDEGCFV